MIQTNFYEAIFKRKSVRNYTLEFLDEQTLKEIQAFSSSVKRLDPTIKTEIRFASRDEIKLVLPIKAPHYLMFYSEKSEGYLVNAGYMLQQIDLFLSMNRIGCCYLGMAQPTQVAKDQSDLDFVMVLAFGNPLETVHRLNLEAFKRKSLGEIAHNINDEQFQLVVEAARVAPSASNKQPWYFVNDHDMMHIYRNKPGFLKAFLYERMNQIDIGIVLYHMTLRLENDRIDYSVVKSDRGEAGVSKNRSYMMSIKIQPAV
jgi:hypothetical protein